MNDFHDPDDPRDFAVGMVEESVVALFHLPEMFPCYSRKQAITLLRLSRCLTDSVANACSR